MTFEELTDLVTERILRKKVVRGGKIIKKRQSNRAGYIIKGGVEKKQTSAEKIKAHKIQKRAAIKRKAQKASANVQRKKSLSIRTWK